MANKNEHCVMKITFLGTGTSTGVPQLNCNCQVCQSTNPKDKRLRSSILIEIDHTKIIIDCGPDFRTQCIRHKIESFDAILFTHEHFDHSFGINELRPFRKANLYAENRVLQSFHDSFPYLFGENPYPGAPQLNLFPINENPFFVNNIQITPIRLIHGKLPILGFRIKDFAYITDFQIIEKSEKEKLKNLDTLIIDVLQQNPHPSHLKLSDAIELLNELQPKQAYFTHISHKMGLHDEVEKILPSNYHLAYDGEILFSTFQS